MGAKVTIEVGSREVQVSPSLLGQMRKAAGEDGITLDEWIQSATVATQQPPSEKVFREWLEA